ncbi:hypothetical protein BCR35DRAFT_284794 [Leucosporidium creatinivorum]|uniref:BTB domain-containing protein n=1 Tax=Leucosporidium creatinivorum TaxID=106004 RepID=A0A1Y2D3Z1_9BASI|nr:hypothetical protein BCR35DRAFT_284794 [Leucosporidium creatinivorum]
MTEAAPTSPALARASSPVSHSPPEQYTVITRGVKFKLSRSQIEYDSPNYFTAAFLDHDFAESRSKVVYLDRHPHLFAFIVEHLSGYEIMPFPTGALPACMTLDSARINLLRDAEYFGLEKLQSILRSPFEGPGGIGDWTKPILQSYLRFCGFEPSSVDPLFTKLVAHDVDHPNDLRSLQHRITYEYLTNDLGITAGEAALLMAHQNDRSWTAWEEQLAKKPKGGN